MKQSGLKKTEVKQLVITNENAGRRIDNYLIAYFDKIPKSRIYQMLRKGEVRVNKGRIKQTYRLNEGDTLRLPPVYENQLEKPIPDRQRSLALLDRVLYEDEGLLVMNKPAGLIVHAGSGQNHGIIEMLRSTSVEYEKLELVHRLDHETSGCLILAKTMPVLRALHEQIKSGSMKKTYLGLLAGRINTKKWIIDKALTKNTMKSGERMVRVDDSGKASITHFYKEQLFANATLARIELITGRTHQIRVHSAYTGNPLLGDTKYGDRDLNRDFRKKGLKRLFLHAAKLTVKSPLNEKQINIEAVLPANLKNVLEIMRRGEVIE